MDCREAARLAQLKLDHEVEAEDCGSLDRHLADCVPCRADYDAQRKLRGLLQSRIPATAPCPATLRERIEREARGASDPRPYPALRVAAVAAGLIVLAGLTVQRDGDDLVEETVARHSRNLPPEVGRDEADVRRFLRENLRYTVSVPELKQGDRRIRLVGARLSNVRDRDAAYVMYDHRGARLSLFAVPSSSPAPSGFERRRAGDRELWVGQRRGYNVVSWQDRELLYSLVSDVDPSELVELASSAR